MFVKLLQAPEFQFAGLHGLLTPKGAPTTKGGCEMRETHRHKARGGKKDGGVKCIKSMGGAVEGRLAAA